MIVRSATAFVIAAILACGYAVGGEDKKEEKKDEKDEFPPQPQVPYLSAEETLKTFQLPPGYRMELVLSEPHIKEPVVCVFDGNGRLYVAEMRSYMQDIDGTNEHAPVGVVSRHESTKGNGVFDKHTVFRKEIVLPRMVLPLDHRVIIGATDTNDLFLYSDKDGNGVADEEEGVPFYEGGPRGGNLEHQPSGLIWAMDNWMYMAGNAYRLRWTGEKPLKEGTASNQGQWGCAQDNNGKVWFSNGGGERTFLNFQTHLQYAAVNMPDQMMNKFMEVWPAVPIPDVQGGPVRFRPEEKTLNHFTASCGHEIFRGDRLPRDLVGDALICEPVGRLIRRAEVEVRDGITYLSNPYEAEKGEFIRSTDPNFRPVNMTTGPDGCLYIVDMYRGIIQEGNWVREGSYLRKVVKQYGLQNNFGRGRIWRLVHKDFKPGPQPRMLDEKSDKLVKYLEHPNGWWRDTAQKLLILRGAKDKKVVEQLEKLARKNDKEKYLPQIHALWTLEGLDALKPELIREKLKSPHAQVRANAIRASESLFKKEDKSLLADIQALQADPDPLVALQSLCTAKVLNWPDHQKVISAACMTHPSRGVKEIGKSVLNVGKPESGDQFSQAELKVLQRGGEIYRELCFGCHGYDGRGMPVTGAAAGITMAPPLQSSKTLMRHRDAVIYVLLHGLTGEVEGKKYDAQMVAMHTNPDDWIAAAGSYVRNSFGNRGALIAPEDVKYIREQTKGRKVPFTLEELERILPKALTDSTQWKLTASDNSDKAALAIDGKEDTRYDTGKFQEPGQWLQIEFPRTQTICGLRMDAAKSGGDFPRGYKVELSADGKEWGKPVAEGKGVGKITEVAFTPAPARFVRITQTGTAEKTFWSIHEMQVIAPSPAGVSAAPVKKDEAKPVAK